MQSQNQIYTLIRECRYPKEEKKLEIFVYEIISEAMIEFFSYLDRISHYSEIYKKYYQLNTVIDKKFFIKNSNWRWDEFKEMFLNNGVNIIMFGMLTENTQEDKIFSLLIEGTIDKYALEELKKVSNYLEIKKESIICNRCDEMVKVSIENSAEGGYYGCHSMASYYEVTKEFDSEGECSLYFRVKGHYDGKILIKKDQEKYKVGDKICEYCMEMYDQDKFEVIEMH